MTPDKADAALAAMTTHREQELAGVEAHYKLRKACTARAVELYELLLAISERQHVVSYQQIIDIDAIIEQIKDDAK
jgi:hypothetical protein